MLMNKANSLKVQSEAYDMVRQSLWRAAEVTKEDKKKKGLERMLVALDESLYFNHQMLHDIIQGKDAQFVCKIRPDGMVLLGHEHQAVYFSLDWDDIHKLSADIKAFEQELVKEKDLIIAKQEENIIRIKEMLDQRLITKDDANRYLRSFELPEYVTADWLRDHVMSREEHHRVAGSKLARRWEKTNQLKSPKITGKPKQDDD
jgi:hypothetical protein